MTETGRRRLLLLGAAASVAGAARPIPLEPNNGEREAMTALAEEFRLNLGVPGVSVAIGYAGRILHADAYGSDGDGQTLTPVHRFRIASISKTLTATAVFQLIEQRRLRLNETVFGDRGVLGKRFGPVSGPVAAITVEQLLTHTVGAWSSDMHDPMFHQVQMDHAELIAWVLHTYPLRQPPGRSFAYSNFGYCLLGRVIEAVSGQRYDAFVTEHVLRPSGADSMAIGGSTRAERLDNEVCYIGVDDLDVGYVGYGMNVPRLDSCGGWIATPSDLTRFAMQLDGLGLDAALLTAGSLREMGKPSGVNPGYAHGWQINSVPNWWHMGGLQGTSTILMRAANGFRWAALTNTRQKGRLAVELDRLMWAMVRQVPSWGV